jgi:hypothetical protein
MKIEQLLISFFVQNKKFSLQGIGSFYLLADPIVSKDDIQNFVLPENSIEFKSDKNTEQDELLIQYISEITKKIKPLATSDLESFTMLNKQFLNLGKPIILEGIGSITKKKEGILEFTQANKIILHHETASGYDTKEISDQFLKNTNKDISSKKTKKSNLIFFSLIFLFTIIIAIVIYYFLQNSKKDTIQPNEENEVQAIQNDTAQIKKDSLVALESTLLLKVDSIRNFKIIVGTYTSLIQAKKGFKSLSESKTRKNLIMYTKDSVEYYLAVPILGNINDTIKIKDSIIKQFGKKVFIDLN